jgi:uncharacterized membrane-anchored protein
MKFIKIFLLALFLSLNAFSAQNENPLDKLKWQIGPNEQIIDGKATLKVPEYYVFLDKEETNKYSEISHNPTDGKDSLFLSDKWEAYLHFDAIGYVKDNETIDADALLTQYKEGVKIGNKQRAEKGWDTLEVDGWFFKPQYDKEKKLLEWAFLLRNAKTQAPVVNYYTRILGRTGVMSILLVSRPEDMNASITDFKQKLNGFEFNAGEKYTEFKQGDKVAEYGLAALILGGAAAVATKKGFWAALAGFFAAAWKFVVVAVIAFFSKIKDLFSSLFKKSDK